MNKNLTVFVILHKSDSEFSNHITVLVIKVTIKSYIIVIFDNTKPDNLLKITVKD